MAVQIHRVWYVYSEESKESFVVNAPFPVVYEYPLRPFVFSVETQASPHPSLVVYAEEAEVVQ